MAVTVAINGFGRIGRLVLRAIVESGRTDIVPVAINGPGTAEGNAHLFLYDSVHGRFNGEVETTETSMTVKSGGRSWGPMRFTSERDPSKVSYEGVDLKDLGDGLAWPVLRLAGRARPVFTLASPVMTVDRQAVPNDRFEEVNEPAV